MNRGTRILDPLFDYTPDWLPLPRFIRRRQERRNRWPPFKDDDSLDILKVHKVSLNINENGSLHNTDKYDSMLNKEKPKLIVRRGQEFAINFFFTRPYNKDTDGISFMFSYADGKPSLSHGTLVIVPLLSKSNFSSNDSAWTASIEELEDNRVKVQFKTSSKCSVGKWKVAVDTKLKEDQAAISHNFKEPIYILFNPWNPDDEVYMEGIEDRYEYVLEDTGLIWRGSHNRLRPTPWAYSQFEKDVLDCALYLLSGPGHLSATARADPIRTSRAISSAVNSPDEDGLLEGNWSDKFEGGVPPTKWTGSLKIIQKYLLNKKPVKYGQCWVFAGVVCTICRTLGIPCRPVTNYQSAHDTQSSLTVDYFLDGDGKAVEELNTDSVWNFHVWNEAWMTRPDIDQVDDSEKVYSGWQVIDATPQERSDEMYRCGPASVRATRRGDIKRPFDGPFVFSEVNADKVYWHYQGVSRPLKLLGKKEAAIGLLISTKAKGKFEREDITGNYKHPEKSSEERETMLNALRQSESLFSRYYLNEDFNDVRFDFELRDDIVIGSPFSVILKVRNVSQDNDFNVHISLRVDTMLYTGKIKEQVKHEKYDILIDRSSEKELALEVTYDDYFSKLCDHDQCAFNIACLAKVEQTSFEYFAQDDFRVRKPDIKFQIKGEDDIVVGEAFLGTATLKNPLPVQLKKCQFLIDGPGLGETLKIKLKENIQPGEIAEADFELTPRVAGEKTVSAKFTSNELQDVDGFVTIVVNPNNEIPPITENEL